MLMRIPGSYCARAHVSYGRISTTSKGAYASVHSGDGDEWAGGAAATALDVDLSAAKVELGASVRRSDMESDLSEGSACSATTDGSHPRPTCSTRMRYWPLGSSEGIVKVTSDWAVDAGSVSGIFRSK